MRPSLRSWTRRLATGEGPVYLGLAEVIADAVKQGELLPGGRLPPQRELARLLGMDLTTVSRAIREAQRRGLVVTRGRAGSFIAALPVESKEPGGVVDLSVNYPPPLPEPLQQSLREIIAECAATLPASELMDYPRSVWSHRHTEAGVAWCASLAMPATEDRIVLAGGAQQALLGLTTLLCQPGDTILTAGLTYPGLIAVARRMGLRIIGLEQDDEGVIPEALEEACRRAHPRFLYLVPTFQNPTAASASRARRVALAAVIRRADIRLVEDDGHAALLQPHRAPVSSLVPERSYYLSGLSKSVSPGLRTAYVVAPSAEESSRLRAALVSLGQFPAPIAAAVAAAAVHRGVAMAAAAAMRRRAAERWMVAAGILPELQSGADTTNHFGWLRLPTRWRGDAFATRVRSLGVEVTPASAFAVTPGLSVAAVRVCLGAPATLDQLAGGLKVLASTLAEDPAVIRVYY